MTNNIKQTPRRLFMSQADQLSMGTQPRTHYNCVKAVGVQRPGKTAKDRAMGVFVQNELNKEMRREWGNSSNRHNPSFPRDTCNGKKNRYLK